MLLDDAKYTNVLLCKASDCTIAIGGIAGTVRPIGIHGRVLRVPAQASWVCHPRKLPVRFFC